MNSAVQLRIIVSETTADQVRRRVEALPFRISYEEEQHGPTLIILIGCTIAQEKTVREMLREIGVSTSMPADE